MQCCDMCGSSDRTVQSFCDDCYREMETEAKKAESDFDKYWQTSLFKWNNNMSLNILTFPIFQRTEERYLEILRRFDAMYKTEAYANYQCEWNDDNEEHWNPIALADATMRIADVENPKQEDVASMHLYGEDGCLYRIAIAARMDDDYTNQESNLYRDFAEINMFDEIWKLAETYSMLDCAAE